MNYAEILGLLATCTIVISIFQTSTVKLRIINTLGSVMMVVYGLWIGALSVWILNTICAIINVWRLYQHRNHLGESKGGCIIIGYQGIGKSTAAARHLDYIDLESSTTKINGERHDDWFIPYCQSAYHLARQGYVVFVSSHSVLREYLESTHESEGVKVYTCFPSVALKTQWVKKLNSRYHRTKSDKDYAAWQNAEKMYTENITALKTSPLPSIIISSMRYDLDAFIEAIR